MLNKVRVGNIDDDVENLLKAKLINESDENYSKDTLHMYGENEAAMKNIYNFCYNVLVLKKIGKTLKNCSFRTLFKEKQDQKN